MANLRLFLVVVLLAAACGSPTTPSISSIQSLQAVSTSVTIGGKTLTLSTFANRDFMPCAGSGCGNSALTIGLTVKTSDGSEVPSTVTIDAIWATNGSLMSSAFALVSHRADFLPDYVVNATNGPLWDVGAMVTTVIRLTDGHGTSMLLRAPSQKITSSS